MRNNLVKSLNLILGGGGIKGIAYSGAYEVAEQKGYNFIDIAGVSAGAIAGSIIGAGYSAVDIRKITDSFDYEMIKVEEIAKKVPVVARYLEFSREFRYSHEMAVKYFFNQDPNTKWYNADNRYRSGSADYRGNMIKNIITYSKEGCLFDGDYMEEWVYKILKNRGIRTFGDLRGGLADEINPAGYKVRILAVDATREKAIVLPDDMVFYGIKPDDLEVAKAVRMSASVPFAFKPVEIKKQDGDMVRVYNIVDGGVLDNFPLWMTGNANILSTIGFSLDGGEKKKLLSLDTPLQILKFIISSIHDTGIPKHYSLRNKYAAKINTGMVSALDFGLSEGEKEYLYNQGKYAALFLFSKIESNIGIIRRPRIFYYFPNRWR